MLRPWKCMFLPTVYRHFSLVHAETCLDHVRPCIFLGFSHGPWLIWLNRPWSLPSFAPKLPRFRAKLFSGLKSVSYEVVPCTQATFFWGGIGSIWVTSWYGAFQWYIYLMVCIYIYMVLSIVMGVQNSWMVYFMENPPQLLRNLHIFLGE